MQVVIKEVIKIVEVEVIKVIREEVIREVEVIKYGASHVHRTTRGMGLMS